MTTATEALTEQAFILHAAALILTCFCLISRARYGSVGWLYIVRVCGWMRGCYKFSVSEGTGCNYMTR